MFQDTTQYTYETSTVMLGKKQIMLVDGTPILTPKERERRRAEIEEKLYKIFSKYVKSSK